jgi:asparagine synthase (glutamine-hydrolysing)
MSGICGVFSRNGKPIVESEVALMLSTMRHRGPDRAALCNSGPVCLGHCMLHTTLESLSEVLPRAEGARFAITADARIDNRLELIASLGLDPHAFHSDSDLILQAYEKWGEDSPDRLIGDFAFVIWDGANRRLFCACDPMGVKSLYYHSTPKAFSFGSEIKALLALPDVPRQLNELRVAEYLVTLFEDRETTFYQGILRLPGAHSLTVDATTLKVRQYWSLDTKRELRLGSDDEYAEAFREIFLEAVRCRTRSAYPIGSALSGGLDSSAIACAARSLKPAGSAPLHTFSLVFPGLPEEDRRVIDERSHIQTVLKTGGFEPHSIEADRLSPMGDLDRVHYHLDYANATPNLYLHWAMYESAQQNGVRVFLDGFDGDSAVSHGFERLTELGQTLRWRTLWREVSSLSRHQLAGIPRRRIVKEYCLKPLTPRWAYLSWQVLHGRRREALAQNRVISRQLLLRTGIERRAHDLLGPQNTWSMIQSAREVHASMINQALYSYTLDVSDKASAAFGIEARYPFFDRRVLEFCLALPAEQKLGGGWNRWIMRRAMAGVLPEGIQWRPNKGNLSPNFHRRLLDFDREKLEQIALNRSLDLAPYLDFDAMQSVYREYEKTHAQSRGESIQLFIAVNLALWLRSMKFAA